MIKFINFGSPYQYFDIEKNISSNDKEVLSIITKKVIDTNTNTFLSKRLLDIDLDVEYNFKDIIESNSNIITCNKNVSYSIGTYINQKGSESEIVELHNTGGSGANLFVIALPFNGILKNIPSDPKYRILKALILKDNSSEEWATRSILYLVLHINYGLFAPKHPYHTDKIHLEFSAFNKMKREEVSSYIDITNDDVVISQERFTDLLNPTFINIKNDPVWVIYNPNKSREEVLLKSQEITKEYNKQLAQHNQVKEFVYKDYSDREYERQYSRGKNKGTKKKGPARKSKKRKNR